MANEPLRCQGDTVFSGSYPVSWLAMNSRKLRWYLSNRGVIATLQKIISILERGLLPRWLARSPEKARSAVVRTSLNLQPGELVEVKSEQEIADCLDTENATGGLAFMGAMRPYFGKRLRVYKRVRHILCEFGGGERKLANTVLLEGAICDGREQDCDRSCFFFWREAWLRRIPEESASSSQPQPIASTKSNNEVISVP